MKLLLILIFLVFGGGLLILSLLKSIGQLIFGKPVSSTRQNYSRMNNNPYDTERKQAQKKIFDRNEGEYVKYEEIKD